MSLLALTFVSVFVLVASAGLLIFGWKKRPRMGSALVSEFDRIKPAGPWGQAGESIGNFVQHFDRVLPKSQSEVSVLRQRLIRAGFREDSAAKIFFGTKVLGMTIVTIAAFATGLAALNYFLVIAFALGVGFLAPDFWLGRRIRDRQKQIRLSLPDLLDLLVVCVEAGLSIDQATARTASELARTHKAIADELMVLVLEQRAGCPRADAWRHFAERTDVQSVRSVVTMLVQCEQFGTSIARTLRVHAQASRSRRIQQVEEEAAKTGIKILFPLVLCIFPNLFLVVLGPAIMLMLDSLQSNFNH